MYRASGSSSPRHQQHRQKLSPRQHRTEASSSHPDKQVTCHDHTLLTIPAHLPKFQPQIERSGNRYICPSHFQGHGGMLLVLWGQERVIVFRSFIVYRSSILIILFYFTIQSLALVLFIFMNFFNMKLKITKYIMKQRRHECLAKVEYIFFGERGVSWI